MAFKIRPFSLFANSSRCLRTLGFWPGPENRSIQHKHLARSVLNCILSAVILVFQLNFAFNSTENLSAMIESLVLSCTRILVIIKLSVFFLKRREFQVLLETFDGLVTNDTKSSSRAINNSMRKSELFFTGGFLCLGGSTVFFYVTAPVIKYLLSGVNTWELPFMVKLPFDYHQVLAYPLIFLVLSYSLCVMLVTLVGVDGLLFGSCLYIAGQFKIIERKINDMVDLTNPSNPNPLPSDKNREIKKTLIEIIDQQNLCFDLTKQVSRIYENIVFTQFVTSSVVMAMSSLNIALSKGPDKLTFVSYLLTAVVQIFGFCKNGSALKDSNEKIATAIYNFEWYKYDKDVKYLVLIILMRSQRTNELKIPFCSASMATFAKYLKSTGSFVTLLQSFL